jgi:hypothetical protein
MVSVRRAAPWLGAFLSAASPAGAGELLDPLSAAVLHPPSPVRGDDGTTHLAYELHVTNMTSEPLALECVEVLDAGGLLRRIEDRDLAASFRAFGVTRPVWESSARADRLTLAAGMSGLLYMWVTAPEQRAFTSPLRHRIAVATGTGSVRTVTSIELMPAALASRPVLTIGPPVRGGPWLASNGPSKASGHRRLPITRHGRLTVFQRYAIDYLKLDAMGRQHVGDWRVNASHFTQGEEAVAVADSVVAAVRDGIPENVPDELPEGDALSLDTVYGNAVNTPFTPISCPGASA